MFTSNVVFEVCVAVAGIACIGMSIGISFGLSSAVGFAYGPLNSLLPFLLLGIIIIYLFFIEIGQFLLKMTVKPVILKLRVKFIQQIYTVVSGYNERLWTTKLYSL